MAAKRSKPVSFNAVVKFALQHYQIPTKKDIDKLNAKLDQLEGLIQGSVLGARRAKAGQALPGGDAPLTASDRVLEIIAAAPEGISFADIKTKTLYPDKKLRNIVFRLSKINKIRRLERGVYTVIPQ
ncbi:MAG: hypothetical protein LJE63_14065 [Desulfobacteraceae bacterium]|jgi:hypothetical protein|nr:hypothetical protein [Desulfobacteraceae bacterium]